MVFIFGSLIEINVSIDVEIRINSFVNPATKVIPC